MVVLLDYNILSLLDLLFSSMNVVSDQFPCVYSIHLGSSLFFIFLPEQCIPGPQCFDRSILKMCQVCLNCYVPL